MERREWVTALFEQGFSVREIVAETGVRRRTVYYWWTEWRRRQEGAEPGPP